MVEPKPTYTRLLLLGLAVAVDEAGIAKWRDPDGPPDDALYQPDEFAIVLQQAIPAEPEWAMSIRAYMTDDDARLPVAATSVQFRIRVGEDPLDAVDVADALRDRFHRATHQQYGDITITTSKRISFADLGADANGKAEVSCNFRFVGLRALNPTKTLPTGE